MHPELMSQRPEYVCAHGCNKDNVFHVQHTEPHVHRGHPFASMLAKKLGVSLRKELLQLTVQYSSSDTRHVEIKLLLYE